MTLMFGATFFSKVIDDKDYVPEDVVVMPARDKTIDRPASYYEILALSRRVRVPDRTERRALIAWHDPNRCH